MVFSSHNIARWIVRIAVALAGCFFALAFYRQISERQLLLTLKMTPQSSVEFVYCVDGAWDFQSVPVFSDWTDVTLTFPEGADVLRLDCGSRSAEVEIREIRVRRGFRECRIAPDRFAEFFGSPNQISDFAFTDSHVSFRTTGDDGFWIAGNLASVETHDIAWEPIAICSGALAVLLLLLALSRRIAAAIVFFMKNYSCKTKILAHKEAGLDQLTSLRFFAALMILIHHTLGHVGVGGGGYEGLANGVSFFFVLSGFILAYSYRDLSDRAKIMNFYKNRIGRIWPLHILILLLTFVFMFDWLSARGQFQNPWLLVANVLLVQSWIPSLDFNYSFNAVSWSISTELFFYLCLPLILKFRRAALTLSLTAIAVCLLAADRGWVPITSDNAVSADSLLYTWPPVRILEFILGVLMFDLFAKHRIRVNFFSGTILELAALAVSAVWICLLPYVSEWLKPIFGDGTKWYFMNCGFSLLAVLLIYAFACNTGAVSRLLQLKPFVLLGEISFSVYLTHQLVIFWVQGHMALFANWPTVLLVAAVYAFVLMLSFLLWKFFETPVRYCVRKINIFEHRNGSDVMRIKCR